MSDANAASAPIAGASFAAGQAAAARLQPSSPIPFRPSAPDEAGGSNILGALLVCAACLVAAIAALRRWGPPGGRRTGGGRRLVEVVESARLADRMRVSVIRYRGRELLVAHSDHAATVLARDADTDAADPGAGS
jgi:flagellar biogenesis protein FliO